MVIEKAASVADTTADKTKIFYPESDGMPLPDGLHQYKYFLEILSVLELFFSTRPDVAVGGDIFIYYVEGNRQMRVAPDCFVVFGGDIESLERNDTYLLWEVGKPPDFVLEIGSPSTANNDLTGKRDLYAQLGMGEYWRYDPTGEDHYGEPLVGERLTDGEYQALEIVHEVDGGVWGYSPALNLELHWKEDRLRFHDPAAGRWLQNIEEINAARESAETRANAAEARIAEMDAELRRLRGE